MSSLNILVVGKGGREHALAWKITQSPLVDKVFVAPGNPGMEWDDLNLVDISEDNFSALMEFYKEKNIDFCLVGPEAPLALGICDAFRKEGLNIIGANQGAAQLEASKNFCKEVLLKAGLKTAEYQFFNESAKAKEFIKSNPWQGNIVVKADGLAAGKGVVVCTKSTDALEALDFIEDMQKKAKQDFAVVIEEALIGKEFSAFALCNGNSFINFSSACDYKRLNTDINSPNTGGMGAYSPASWITEEDQNELQEIIFPNTLRAMQELGKDFNGFLFAGLMKTQKGIYVLEFNVRFGDPETQCIMPLIDEDIVPHLLKVAKMESFENQSLQLKKGYSVYVVQAAKGYPHGPIEKGLAIECKELPALKAEGAHTFFAGVAGSKEDLVSNGGRVLGINAVSKDLAIARELSYKWTEKIRFKNRQFREDIAK